MGDEQRSSRRPDPARRSDYRGARIVIAGFLSGGILFMLVADAASASYEIPPIVFVSLVAAVLTLLGLEVADIVRLGR